MTYNQLTLLSALLGAIPMSSSDAAITLGPKAAAAVIMAQAACERALAGLSGYMASVRDKVPEGADVREVMEEAWRAKLTESVEVSCRPWSADTMAGVTAVLGVIGDVDIPGGGKVPRRELLTAVAAALCTEG